MNKKASPAYTGLIGSLQGTLVVYVLDRIRELFVLVFGPIFIRECKFIVYMLVLIENKLPKYTL
ncbi:MAG TPA: hypothetical protein VJ455_10865 [Ignavibacteria bacterium]|nr:hypothetical protein [Ignavibacteria bacterium]